MKEEIKKFIEKLNSQQKNAVESIDGPVLVVAGPGTGKTQVLALRIANILIKTDTNASNILCLTFTESGVMAMRNRLIKIIGNEAYYIRIHTFHSFCNEVIQNFPEKFAFAKELTQLDDLNKIKLIRKVIDDFEVDNDEKTQLIPFHDKYFYQNNILSSIQTLKREGIKPETLEKKVILNLESLEKSKQLNKKTFKPTALWSASYKNELKNLELYKLYKLYSSKLLSMGFYDYEDMILFVISKFDNDNELLSFYQEKFLYILVDEYQDTNGAQNELLKELGSFDASPNIFAVGDDDQAIYRFQGASIENLLFFEKQFSNVKTIPITTSYRSSQLILDFSTYFIEHNKARLSNLFTNLDKKLTAGLNIPNNKVSIYNFSNNEVENKFLIQKIKEINNKGVAYSDIAILYRKHSDSEDIIESLVNANIPLRLAIGKNSLNEKIIQQFINLIKVIHYTDKRRDFLLFQVLFYDFFNFDRLDIFKITRIANDSKISIFDLINNKEKLLENKIINVDKINNFAISIIYWKALSANSSLAQFIQRIAIESNLINYIFQESINIEYINSINSFYSYIKEINRQNSKITLSEFLEDISLLEDNKISINEKELDSNKDGVNLMTAHKAKGLEYKYIFIVKFYNGNWGGRTNREIIKLPKELFKLTEKNISEDLNIDEIEDERRLLFVSLTRAKEKIFITSAKEYPSGNSTKEVSVSLFVNEFNEKLVEFPDTSSYESFEKEFYLNTVFNSKITSPYNLDEREYLSSVISKFKLSATSLNEYIECPLKFKFNRILKIPKYINKSEALGISIHSTLENFFRSLKNDKKENLDYLHLNFENALKKQLLDKDDFIATLSEGNLLLTQYFNHYNQSFIKPIEVEYGFYGRNLILEVPEIEAIPLSGKLDKIEWTNELQNEIRIVDYKTMTPSSSNEIKGLTKNSTGKLYRQLTFYKLLTECDKSFRPSLSSPKYRVKEVEIDFLKPNQRGIFKKEKFIINNEEVDQLKLKIVDVMTHIRNLEFLGSLEYPLCKDCEFCKMIK